jgi:hypothetical protein
LPCRIALREEQHLQAMLKAQPTVSLSAGRAFKQLRPALDGRHTRRARWTPLLGGGLRWHAVTATVLVAGLGAAAWLATLHNDESPPEFTTLTTLTRDARQLDVVFRRGVSAAEVADLIGAIDGAITTGPDAIGRYRIRLNGAGAEDVLPRLQSDPRVEFAAPAFGEESEP